MVVETTMDLLPGTTILRINVVLRVDFLGIEIAAIRHNYPIYITWEQEVVSMKKIIVKYLVHLMRRFGIVITLRVLNNNNNNNNNRMLERVRLYFLDH